MIDVTNRKRPHIAEQQRKPSRLERFGKALDEVFMAVSPVRGEQRLAARTRRRLIKKQNAESKLGHPTMHPSVARDHRFVGSRQDTDDQLDQSLEGMQYRSREMVVTNPHASGAIEGRIAHEIGVGLACRPEIVEVPGVISEEDAHLANNRLVEVCRDWSEYGVDRQRQFSLAAVQRIAQRTYAAFGEVFLLLREAPFQGPIGLTVEVVNPMRCETPHEFRQDENVRLGIRYDPDTEAILGYYFRKDSSKTGPRSRSRLNTEYTYIERVDRQGLQRVCHVFEPVLPDQSRGIPWLMAAIPFVKDIDDYHEAELINKQVEACLGVIISGSRPNGTPHEIAEGNAVDTDAYSGNRVEELYPGMIHYQDDTGEVKVIDPSRPGGTFAPFIEAGLRAVSAAANYPYELLAKNFFRTTFSSGRLAMLDGKLGFDMRRDVLITMGMKPVWRRVVNDAFFHGKMEGLMTRVQYIANRHVWERHAWGGEAFGAIDPEKELKAHKVGLATDQETLSMVAAEKNMNWRDLVQQRHTEKLEQIRLRLEREKAEIDMRKEMGLPEMSPPDDDDDDDDGDYVETDDPPPGTL